MRCQISAICANISASIFQFAPRKLAVYGLCGLLGSLTLNAQNSFAYSLDQPQYQQGEMEISPEHFKLANQNQESPVSASNQSSPHNSANIKDSSNRNSSTKRSSQIKLSSEQLQHMQKLSKTLPKMPQPILTEISRLSMKKDLLLLFGADEFYTFLGCVNCSTNEALSIWNPRGPFGSTKSKYSIWSPSYEFGNAKTQYSPWNQFGRNPPILMDTRGNVHGVLTLNQYNINQSKTATAAFLYKNFEQIRLDPTTWFKTLFKDSKNPVLDIPETVVGSTLETDLNPNALQANISN